MAEVLNWLVLLIVALTAGLVVILLVRVPRGLQGAGKDVRDELRIGREESRGAGKELREEVSAGIKSMSDMLFKTLEGMGKGQQTQLEGMTKHLLIF